MKELPYYRTVVLNLYCLLFQATVAFAQPPVHEARLLTEYKTADAVQGLAADAQYIFAINNSRITMLDKESGNSLRQWNSRDKGNVRLIHLDSGMVKDGLLLAAHSNYPGIPMTSSIEIWQADTLEHVRSYNFGEMPGSLTWLDYHDGNWWGTFANYDLVQPGTNEPYGMTRETFLVKLDDDFNILQRWHFPPALLERFTPMSNSGGTWGTDGFLYITGHDHPELYVLRVPQDGNDVVWVATVSVPWIEGQGIAWDRSRSDRVMWGISRGERKVVSFIVPEISRQ